MLNYAVLFLAISLTVTAQLLIKKGVEALTDLGLSPTGLVHIVMEIFRNIYLFAGLFVLGFTFLLWIWLVSKMQLNILYPITVSSQIALLALGSWFVFGESVTTQQLIGMAVIVGGIFLLTYSS